MPARRRHRAAPPFAALIGPTATGKSELAVLVAQRLGGEIISADSRQVYRGMDIGTAKIPVDERGGVPHHLIDVVDPDERFTLADWLEEARRLVAEISDHGRLPIVVGGTGLYVSALVDRYRLDGGPADVDVRQRLTADLRAHGLEPLVARLAAVSPAVAERIDPRNPRRVVRALERVESAAGVGEIADPPTHQPYPGRVALIGLQRPREALHAHIAERARRQFDEGLLDETRRLLAAGYDAALPSMSGIGYSEATRHLAGEWSLDEAVAATERRTRRYAKRQLTWFRRDGRVVWVAAGERSASDRGLVDEVAGLIYRCLA